jgi:hypothetical protein
MNCSYQKANCLTLLSANLAHATLETLLSKLLGAIVANLAILALIAYVALVKDVALIVDIAIVALTVDLAVIVM